jgi:hypothetical protein
MKTTIQLLILAVILSVLGSTAEAVPVSFNETFLGGQKDGNFMNVRQGLVASIGFNIAGPGDLAVLKDSAGNTLKSWSPTTDSSGFGSGGQYNILDAKLNFTFSSVDAASEMVRVKAGISDGNTVLAEKIYTLGSPPLIRDSYLFVGSSPLSWDRQRIFRQYADFSIDLLDLGLGDFLTDGRFMTLLLAPEFGNYNDFRIDQANLHVTADPVGAPVPEPGTWLLLGSGLLGLVFGKNLFRRG